MAHERNLLADRSVHSPRMSKAKGHMDEIMVEVGRLNDYIRQYCPEVEALPADVLMDGPTVDDMEQLLRSRVAAIKATTSAEA